MKRHELWYQIHHKRSVLCIGLDTELTKIPTHLLSEKNPILAFNQKIIEATAKYCVAYKINTAFYESIGIQGWENFKKNS